MRQLSIPTVRDRVVQAALKLILEPIFEADFQPESFGYRPKKSAHAAIRRVSQGILEGKTYLIDFDLRVVDSHPRQQWLRQAVVLGNSVTLFPVTIRWRGFSFPGLASDSIDVCRGRSFPGHVEPLVIQSGPALASDGNFRPRKSQYQKFWIYAARRSSALCNFRKPADVVLTLPKPLLLRKSA